MSAGAPSAITRIRLVRDARVNLGLTWPPLGKGDCLGVQPSSSKVVI